MSWINEDGIDTDIAQMFYKDVQEKKNIGRNIFCRAATRKGRINKINYASDLLTGKAKRDYKKAGKVVISNMYDSIENVPSLDDLRGMDKAAAIKIVKVIKKKYTVPELVKQWGIPKSQYYSDVVPEFNIVKIERKARGANKTKTEETKTTADQETAATGSQQQPENKIIPIYQEQIKAPEIEFEGFQIKFAGSYMGENLSDRIMNYISMLDKAARYKIKFIIEELPEDLTKNK